MSQSKQVQKLGDGQNICSKCWANEFPDSAEPALGWTTGQCDYCSQSKHTPEYPFRAVYSEARKEWDIYSCTDQSIDDLTDEQLLDMDYVEPVTCAASISVAGDLPYDFIALIAAAPETAAERDRLREINGELLEALKRMVEVQSKRRHPLGQPNEGIAYAAADAASKARAAIAKAEGGK